MGIREEALGRMLDDALLTARSEEAAWETVVGWRRDAAGEVAWRGVVGKIRFPLMGEDYLRDRVVGGWEVDGGCGGGGTAGQGGATRGDGVRVEAAEADGDGGFGCKVGGVH
jgi:hypothetical protein